MENNYIIRNKNNTLSFNYIAGKIVQKIYANEKWGVETIIITNVRSNFTVNFSSDEKIYIFCQDLKGNVNLCTYTGNDWTIKMVLQNQSEKIYTILFYPIITKTGITLIYNTPANSHGSFLLMQQLGANGVWSKAITIDTFIPMKDTLFTVQNVSEDHYLLFYQTKTTSKNLGYREINSKTFGKYNVFHTTNYQIIDSCYLPTKNEIYILYVTKSSYSSQLIFRKKTDNTFSNPIILCEGQFLENTLIFSTKNVLYVFFTNGTHLFFSTSENNGETFTKPQRYKANVGGEIIKCKYLTENLALNSTFCSNVYVSKTSPHLIKILTDFSNDLYSTVTEIVNEAPTIETENHNLMATKEIIEDLENKIKILENRVATFEVELANKNQQIMYLSQAK